jgi:hypothetical protein
LRIKFAGVPEALFAAHLDKEILRLTDSEGDTVVWLRSTDQETSNNDLLGSWKFESYPLEGEPLVLRNDGTFSAIKLDKSSFPMGDAGEWRCLDNNWVQFKTPSAVTAWRVQAGQGELRFTSHDGDIKRLKPVRKILDDKLSEIRNRLRKEMKNEIIDIPEYQSLRFTISLLLDPILSDINGYRNVSNEDKTEWLEAVTEVKRIELDNLEKRRRSAP